MRSLVALVLLLVSAPAFADLTPEAVKGQIEKTYPVQVLRVDSTKIDGKTAYAVRVMNKDATGNGGLAVTTLMVDPATGQLVPAFRHETSGYSLPAAVVGDPRQVNVPEKGSTWR